MLFKYHGQKSRIELINIVLTHLPKVIITIIFEL